MVTKAFNHTAKFLLLTTCSLAFSYIYPKVVIAFTQKGTREKIVKKESSNAIVVRFGKPNKYRSIHKAVLARCLSLLGKRNIEFFIWGYPDKKVWKIDVSAFSRTVRLETNLYGLRTGQNPFIVSYVLDMKRPYFDGHGESDLERMLNAYTAGAWKQDSRTSQIIIDAKKSHYQKYTDNAESFMDRLTSNDLVVIGQCPGDAAWKETITNVKDNIDLLMRAKREIPATKVYYKPHPRNRRASEEINYITHRNIAEIIPANTSFSHIAHTEAVFATVTSGAGFEAAFRGRRVYTFGVSFYSNWGFTNDVLKCERRSNVLTAEDVFFVLVFLYQRYLLRGLWERVDAYTMDSLNRLILSRK